MKPLTELTNEELQELHDSLEQRVAQYHGFSHAVKILLNGGYGALSNEHNRWYMDDLAESITMSGQLAVRWVERDLNLFLNKICKSNNVDYIVAIDTDSCYVKADKVVELAYPDKDYDQKGVTIFLENFAAKLEQVIAESLEELYRQTNVYEKKLHMKLEAIGSAIWTSKKHYVMALKSFKGVHHFPPKIKMQGIEAVRSSTPKFCREAIKEAIPKIIEADRNWIKAFIDEKREQFSQLPFDQVASPRSVSDVNKWFDKDSIYIKRTPIQVRGALLYNNKVATTKLNYDLPLIQSGDKIRFCYMSLPNPLMENVFAVPDELPEAFQLGDYIDYGKQFDKTFLEPIKNLIKAAGIDISDKIDISQFFSGVMAPEDVEPENGLDLLEDDGFWDGDDEEDLGYD